MNHHLLLRLLSLTFLLVVTISLSAQVSKQQIENDIDYLKELLVEHHPNLYVYSSAEEINRSFEALKESIPQSLSQEESYKLISSVSSIVKDGHLVFLPSQKVLDAYYIKSSLLPFDLFWEKDSAYLIRNYSNDENPKLGQQVTSINGVSTSKIHQTICTGVLQDGHNRPYPQWIINNYLRPYHAFFFGTSPSYKIETVDDDGTKEEVIVTGMTHKEIAKSRKEKYPEFENIFNPEKAIELSLDETTNLATLTIRSFENRELKKYNQNFHREIKNAFSKILKNNVENLILDLRGNQGGQVTNGIFLLRHLVKQPFQAVQKFAKVNKKMANIPDKRIKENNGFGTGYHQPFKEQYTGNLFTLINGGSFSASGIVAHVLNKHERGKLIGEETAGSAYTLVGEPNKEFTLPNSKVQVTIPTLQFVLQEYKGKEKSGTQPNHYVIPKLEDVLSGKDGVMDYVYSLLVTDLIENGN